MKLEKIKECLKQEIEMCNNYLKNEPEECRGFDEFCIALETRKDLCEQFLCMLEGA